MLLIMSLGVHMALHRLRLHKPLGNCNLSIHFLTSHSTWEKNDLYIAFLVHLQYVFSSECQMFRMVMSILWTRLTETGKDWRSVYKVRLSLVIIISFVLFVGQCTCISSGLLRIYWHICPKKFPFIWYENHIATNLLFIHYGIRLDLTQISKKKQKTLKPRNSQNLKSDKILLKK